MIKRVLFKLIGSFVTMWITVSMLSKHRHGGAHGHGHDENDMASHKPKEQHHKDKKHMH
jgi:ABC-type nickel/cobalt efflux system permease component RcnA